MLEIVEIFTDGACKGNPGPGGWAAIVRTRDSEYALSDGERDTTNQRMELTAALNALESLKEPCHVKLYSDSEYLIKGMNVWIHGWVRNGWRNAHKQKVANQDLWRKLYRLTNTTLMSKARHKVEWISVKAHAGHPENEIVDKLANEALQKFL